MIGNLTKDPELAQTNSGISFARFTIAVSRKFQNAEGERETDFLNCIAWRGQAENLHKYQKKGSKIAVVGWLQTGSYEAQDGTKRYTTDIVADEIEFLTSKGNGTGSQNEPTPPPAHDNTTELQPIDDDSLPF